MEILEIEKGSVLPNPRVVYAYPYESMEVGDSFTVPVTARAKVLSFLFNRRRWRDSSNG